MQIEPEPSDMFSCAFSHDFSLWERGPLRHALYQLQPVIKLLSKGFVKESALYQLQPVIKPIIKVC